MAQSRNTTIQNQTKARRLATSHVLPRHHAKSRDALAYLSKLNPTLYRRQEDRQALLYSIGIALLGQRCSRTALECLRQYETDLVLIGDVPSTCFDLLGSVYQFLNSKHENLKKGSFYTGPTIADDFVHDLDFSSGQTICDPSCGSGVFLLRSGAPPDKIHGIDNDPLAIMIATFNYFLKFPDGPTPNLVCSDFFDWFIQNRDTRFDYIIANPPYGADIVLPNDIDSVIESGESFSYFIEFGMKLVKRDGIGRFLVPDALLNVKRHTDIREILLEDLDLTRIRTYSSRFSQLLSDVYQIEVRHGETSVVRMEGPVSASLTKDMIRSLKNNIFAFLSDDDIEIIQQARSVGHLSMHSCKFGLGVVTGNIEEWLSDTCGPRMEPIYTGKEVDRFRLLEAQQFIEFDRDNLQQVAPDDIYRAPVKLVYKTISKTLKVAIDDTASLTTNSANIIVPDLTLMTAKSWAAILNSSVISFLYRKMFGGVNKIGKEHLLALPVPAVSERQMRWIEEELGCAPDKGSLERIDEFVAIELFGLSTTQYDFVRHS